MSELGEVLRRARTEKGITLDEMTEATKIQKRYLIAIEEGNFDQLPGTFYSRAFIKNYADYVGLDANELLSQYMQQVPRSEIESYATYKRTRPAVKREIRWDGWLSKLLLFLFIGLICVLIYFFLVQRDTGDQGETVNPNQINKDIGVKGDTDDQSSNPDQTDDQPVEPEQTPTPPAPAVPEVSLVTQDAKRNVYYEVKNAEEVQVEIKTKAAFWYDAKELTADHKAGKPISSTTLAANQTLTINSPVGVYIKSGAYPSVELKVNGQVIDTSTFEQSATKLYIYVAQKTAQ